LSIFSNKDTGPFYNDQNRTSTAYSGYSGDYKPIFLVKDYQKAGLWRIVPTIGGYHIELVRHVGDKFSL